jgi:hypothetical protein
LEIGLLKGARYLFARSLLLALTTWGRDTEFKHLRFSMPGIIMKAFANLSIGNLQRRQYCALSSYHIMNLGKTALQHQLIINEHGELIWINCEGFYNRFESPSGIVCLMLSVFLATDISSSLLFL